jgi:branched-chain amino acid transport system permease protein
VLDEVLKIIPQVLIGGFIFGSYTGLLAIGFALITQSSKSINIAYGSVAVLGAAITTYMQNFWVGTLTAALLCGPIGLCIGFLVRRSSKLSHGSSYVYPIAISFGFFLIIQEIESNMMAGSTYKPEYPIGGYVDIGIIGLYPTYTILVSALSLMLFVFVWFFLYKTKIGTIIRASFNNSELLSTLGVDVTIPIVLIFFVSTFLSSLAASLTTPIIGLDVERGLNILLWSFLLVFLGGMKNIINTFVGGILLGEAYFISATWLDPRVVEFIIFTVVIGVMVIRQKRVPVEL